MVPSHCFEFRVLRCLFPPKVSRPYKLKPCPHEFALPLTDDERLYLRCFTMLYSDQHYLIWSYSLTYSPNFVFNLAHWLIFLPITKLFFLYLVAMFVSTSLCNKQILVVVVYLDGTSVQHKAILTYLGLAYGYQHMEVLFLCFCRESFKSSRPYMFL